MDSPVDPDHLPDSSGGFCHHFLPEDLIISSQPSMFLQDLTADLKNGKGGQDEQKKKTAKMKSKKRVNNKEKAKRELKGKIQEKMTNEEKENMKRNNAVLCDETKSHKESKVAGKSVMKSLVSTRKYGTN